MKNVLDLLCKDNLGSVTSKFSTCSERQVKVMHQDRPRLYRSSGIPFYKRKSVVLDRFRKLGRFGKVKAQFCKSRDSTCAQQKAFREDEGRLMDWEGAIRIAICSCANSPRWLSQLAEPIRCRQHKRFVVKTICCENQSEGSNL